jgi:glycosyltransferase involved in cell wall biosynthesis
MEATGHSLGGIPDGIHGVTKLGLGFFLSRSLVHYHTDEGNHLWMRLFSRIWRLTRTPYVVTVHSFRDRAEFQNPRVVQQLAAAYANAKAVIAISTEVADALESTLGARHKRTRVIPSNLPLSTWELQATLPHDEAAIWQGAGVRILANAGRIVAYNGRDLYGLDVLIPAFGAIHDSDAALCIAVGDVVDTGLWQNILALASANPRITIVRNLTGPLAPFVHHAHIVVRPTRTEGGPSLSLSEALELGKWAIGSDAVQRPEGTVLFRNEDSQDLSRALVQCVTDARRGHMPPAITPNTDAVEKIMNLYQRVSV